jgi:hypothetical protein
MSAQLAIADMRIIAFVTGAAPVEGTFNQIGVPPSTP